jgi:hypothetical protein
VEFDVLMVVTTKVTTYWDVAPCTVALWIVHGGEVYRLYLEGDGAGGCRKSPVLNLAAGTEPHFRIRAP